MSLHRRAAKRDDNESEIVDALRTLGAKVDAISGAGIPDLLVIDRGAVAVVEVKRSRGRQGVLTAAQGRFHDAAWHHGYKVPIVRSVDEAVSWLTQWRARRKLDEQCQA